MQVRFDHAVLESVVGSTRRYFSAEKDGKFGYPRQLADGSIFIGVSNRTRRPASEPREMLVITFKFHQSGEAAGSASHRATFNARRARRSRTAASFMSKTTIIP